MRRLAELPLLSLCWGGYSQGVPGGTQRGRHIGGLQGPSEYPQSLSDNLLREELLSKTLKDWGADLPMTGKDDPNFKYIFIQKRCRQNHGCMMRSHLNLFLSGLIACNLVFMKSQQRPLARRRSGEDDNTPAQPAARWLWLRRWLSPFLWPHLQPLGLQFQQPATGLGP